MDKETLSNYGWIVICVLVLAVMIALATPFGSYISTAVKSTTQGLFDVNKNALNSTGLINIGDQSFSDGTDTGGSGNGNQPTEIKREVGSVIPYGATYTVKATATTLQGNGAVVFPDAPATDDTYEEGDYIYTYSSYWSVSVKDKTKSAYGEILSEIAGKQITHMDLTFMNCSSLTTAPQIPSTVTHLYNTFTNCKSLTAAPTIPDGVISMGNTFAGCKSITTAPVIPSSVTNMQGTFQGCTSLTGIIEINASPTYYDDCFYNTSKVITLTGISTKLSGLAATSSRGNVTVA